jgi:hypothetical protein
VPRSTVGVRVEIEIEIAAVVLRSQNPRLEIGKDGGSDMV